MMEHRRVTADSPPRPTQIATLDPVRVCGKTINGHSEESAHAPAGAGDEESAFSHKPASNDECNQNPASRCPNFVDFVSR